MSTATRLASAYLEASSRRDELARAMPADEEHARRLAVVEAEMMLLGLGMARLILADKRRRDALTQLGAVLVAADRGGR